MNIPQNARITDAKLELFALGYHSSNYPLGDPYFADGKSNGTKTLHEALHDWDESTVTWQNFGDGSSSVQEESANTPKGEFIDSNFNTSFQVWESFNVTSTVQKHVQDPSSNFGYMVAFGLSRKSALYASSEHSDVQSRPRLTISYTTGGDPLYQLVVENGNNSGFYTAGETVTITAVDSTDHLFTHWSGGTGLMDDTTAITAVLTMPNSNVTVSAVYEEQDVEIKKHMKKILASAVEFKNGKLMLSGFSDKAGIVSLLSLNGREIMRERVSFKNGKVNINMGSSFKGIVIVKVKTELSEIVQKTLIK